MGQLQDELRETRSWFTSWLVAVLLQVALLALLPQPARAGLGVINVNQHKTHPYVPAPPPANDSCSAPDLNRCDDAIATPQDYLGQSGLIDANAYHTGSLCKVTRVRCEFDHHGKSTILSSDDGTVKPQNALTWMEIISSSSTQPSIAVGEYHFEWWDRCLSNYGNLGLPIPRPSGTFFPDLDWCVLAGGYDPPPWTAYGTQEMLEEIGSRSTIVSESATMLRQNGWLHRKSNDGPRRLRWKSWDATSGEWDDDVKRLIGFGYMGALAAGPTRLSIGPYLRELRRNNINFTRVWSVEQWTSLSPGPEGLTPFCGSKATDYDLGCDNPAFYDRLRDFAQQAADRGIVVQLSVFDVHGLIFPESPFRYKDSPYRNENNAPQNYLANSIPTEICWDQGGEGSDPTGEDLLPRECHPLYSFINNEYPELQSFHRRYLRRVAEETGGIGNMMYEIINEALAPTTTPEVEQGDWSDLTTTPPYITQNEDWQIEMARQLRLGLPLSGVARDAFNGDPDGTNLGLKVSDVEAASWIMPTFGAKVKAPTTETGGLGPERTLGYVTSSQAQAFMVGTLPIGTPQNWTKLHLRADLACVAGQLRLGTKTSLTGDGGNQIYVDVTCPAGSELPAPQIRLYKKWGTQTTFLAAIQIDDYSDFHNIRLVIGNNAGTYSAKVYVDGALETNTIALGQGWSFPYVYFWGRVAGQNPYPVDAGKVDNFEAAFFCDVEGAPANCQP